jgi:hypothetical protein
VILENAPVSGVIIEYEFGIATLVSRPRYVLADVIATWACGRYGKTVMSRRGGRRSMRQRLQRSKVALQPVADRPVMAAQTVGHPTAAAFQQMGVQRREALEHRDWYEEVPARIADKPFDFAVGSRRRGSRP